MGWFSRRPGRCGSVTPVVARRSEAAAKVVWVEVLVSACVVLKHHVLSVLRCYRLMVTSTFAAFWVRELPR